MAASIVAAWCRNGELGVLCASLCVPNRHQPLQSSGDHPSALLPPLPPLPLPLPSTARGPCVRYDTPAHLAIGEYSGIHCVLLVCPDHMLESCPLPTFHSHPWSSTNKQAPPNSRKVNLGPPLVTFPVDLCTSGDLRTGGCTQRACEYPSFLTTSSGCSLMPELFTLKEAPHRIARERDPDCELHSCNIFHHYKAYTMSSQGSPNHCNKSF